MAKRNGPKDSSDVVFDTHSKVVMSQGGTFGKMKEKINAVRAVVPNRSNNEIVLVLQHFENCVDHAVQAFVEGSATEILKEWNVSGKKKPKKKKKPKIPAESQTEPVPGESTSPSDGRDAVNGLHGNGSALDGDSADSLSERLDPASLDAADPDARSTVSEFAELAPGTEMDARTASLNPGSRHSQGGQNSRAVQQRAQNGRARFVPGCNSQQASAQAAQDNSTNIGTTVKKVAPNIDKSIKDLQRCSASLSRYRVVVKEEMDSSIKRMKQTFAELQSCLMDREVALLAEMDQVKAEALAILDTRQKKAEDLRHLSDRSVAMTEDQLSELRADIKHFVSERKYDEDLGKAVKFTRDLESLKKSIMSFGQVYHPQTGYSTRSRCSLPPSPLIASPKVGVQTQHPPTTASGHGASQGHKQGQQGSVQLIQGVAAELGAQSLNGGQHQDRNLSRTGHRYQNSRGQVDSLHVNPRTAALCPTTRNGLGQSGAPSSRPSSTTPNGLPQRAPRPHRP